MTIPPLCRQMHILIADDHVLFRAGLKRVVADLVTDPVFLEAGTLAEVQDVLAGRPEVELVLLDLAMPGMEGPWDVERIADIAPNVLTVVVSGSENRVDVSQAIGAGAVGFIPKSSNPAVMLGALRLVLEGGVYVPPNLIEHSPRPAARTGGGRRRDEHALTPRQQEVLALLAQGKSNKEVARALELSISAVKLHVAAVLQELGASNRAEAATIAVRRGLIPG